MAPPLDPPMTRAIELAWESFCAGSLGIGCTVTIGDQVIATGRNRVFETDPGDDVLAGSTLAHAEMNALAKLRAGHHRDDHVVLWTTLQPCLQCLGAIRLSAVDEVRVLAPDPLFRGVERARELTPFLASRWPRIEERNIDEWSVFSLLLLTHVGVFWRSPAPGWGDALPTLSGVAADLVSSGELLGFADSVAPVNDVVDALTSRLRMCAEEVAAVAAMATD